MNYGVKLASELTELSLSDVGYMIDHSFIERCMSDEFQESIRQEIEDAFYRRNKWKIENPEAMRERQRFYSRSEKGKKARYKTIQKRNENIKAQIKELTTEELQAIQKFYQDTPEGLHVDHIIPLSKGGRHHISNLQYLTPSENAKKHVSLEWKPTPDQP